MTMPNAPAGTSPAAGIPTSPVPAPPSWPWRRATLFLAGAAQLMTSTESTGARRGDRQLRVGTDRSGHQPAHSVVFAADQVGAALATSHPVDQS